jgi:hypothetical protein
MGSAASVAEGAHVEGRLSLNTRGQARRSHSARLAVAAWEVQPMGQVGWRKPKVQSRD